MAMKISTLILRSMRKNIKHYYLYFFALIFSSALYFSFVTLQHNDAIDQLTQSSIKAGAGFKVGAIMLVIIVFFFVFYANQLFLKRRSKEIGLYQIVGMPKSTISYILALENLLLWVAALVAGILIGFLFSRFFALIFLKIIHVDGLVMLDFSFIALAQTLIVFAGLFIIVLIQTTWVVNRSTLLQLFHTTSNSEQKMKKMNPLQLILGAVGLAAIVYGYYLSTTIFNISEHANENTLFIKMGFVLASVIIGTYFVFRFSIALIMNAIRSSKNGHLSLKDVLAVSPIMHRMKSNALSLSIITILTALALTVLSLSSITYYSIGAQTEQYTPYDMSVANDEGGAFEQSLRKKGIGYTADHYELLNVPVDFKPLMKDEQANLGSAENPYSDTIALKESDVKKKLPSIKLDKNEAFILGYNSIFQKLMPFEIGKQLKLKINNTFEKLTLVGIEEKNSIPSELTFGGNTIVLPDQLFNQLKENKQILNQTGWRTYTGYTITNSDQMDKAASLYKKSTKKGIFKSHSKGSLASQVQFDIKSETYKQSLENIGLLIFVTGFLGLAFLLATGSILYFKQMTEAEEERESFKTLRKIGFTTDEIMIGIRRKQLFSFGIPLVVGVCHSYFAVKSGWMLFGTELAIPLVVTIGIYIVLYSIFAILSTKYYRKIVNDSLPQ